ncbi:Protein of unknown function [Actinokineospora alba]|uniref:Uncharacterized protein n=1 Tax=Actinokineospora alba TaxID=504798 RepID=A0A1H0FSM1_9PSEU|nr:uncharacterized protein DUF3375 [Actinokineospora alba]SDI13430.1 Protein of unknown function [Actinokineospora alba]SDN97479.1 Protein of unknown function [Actinokineospora alba]
MPRWPRYSTSSTWTDLARGMTGMWLTAYAPEAGRAAGVVLHRGPLTAAAWAERAATVHARSTRAVTADSLRLDRRRRQRSRPPRGLAGTPGLQSRSRVRQEQDLQLPCHARQPAVCLLSRRRTVGAHLGPSCRSAFWRSQPPGVRHRGLRPTYLRMGTPTAHPTATVARTPAPYNPFYGKAGRSPGSRKWAAFRIAVFRCTFTRDRRSIQADRLHVQVDAFLNEFQNEGVEVPPNANGRTLCNQWVNEQWTLLFWSASGRSPLSVARRASPPRSPSPVSNATLPWPPTRTCRSRTSTSATWAATRSHQRPLPHRGCTQPSKTPGTPSECRTNGPIGTTPSCRWQCQLKTR